MMTGRDVGGDVPSEMTAICAKETAGVDVNRTLRSRRGTSLGARGADVGRDRAKSF